MSRTFVKLRQFLEIGIGNIVKMQESIKCYKNFDFKVHIGFIQEKGKESFSRPRAIEDARRANF